MAEASGDREKRVGDERRCAICDSPIPPDREGVFCSPRCRTIDLGKWLDGSYTISRPIEQRDLEEGVD
ncbi:DNA gyrase inhibitor YacG [Mucisphaera sp.]|uniref:DNA gyrase inhibitor YacG n=1 Tax=Mucisphaera sp. TaxID=2913024 RepID=UPI003D101595